MPEICFGKYQAYPALVLHVLSFNKRKKEKITFCILKKRKEKKRKEKKKKERKKESLYGKKQERKQKNLKKKRKKDRLAVPDPKPT